MKRQYVFFCEESQKLTINSFIHGLNDNGFTVIQLIFEGLKYNYRSFMVLAEK